METKENPGVLIQKTEVCSEDSSEKQRDNLLFQECSSAKTLKIYLQSAGSLKRRHRRRCLSVELHKLEIS